MRSALDDLDPSDGRAPMPGVLSGVRGQADSIHRRQRMQHAAAGGIGASLWLVLLLVVVLRPQSTPITMVPATNPTGSTSNPTGSSVTQPGSPPIRRTYELPANFRATSLVAAKGSLWIGGTPAGDGNGIFRLNPVSGQIERAYDTSDPVIDVVLAGRKIYALTALLESAASGPVTDSRLFEIDPETGEMHPVLDFAGSMRRTLDGSTEAVIIADADGTVIRFDLGARSVSWKVTVPSSSGPGMPSVGHALDGTIWLGYDTAAFHLNPDGTIKETYPNPAGARQAQVAGNLGALWIAWASTDEVGGDPIELRAGDTGAAQRSSSFRTPPIAGAMRPTDEGLWVSLEPGEGTSPESVFILATTLEPATPPVPGVVAYAGNGSVWTIIDDHTIVEIDSTGISMLPR